MESKSILIGVIVGVVVGGFAGFMFTPSPDISSYETLILQLESEVVGLQSEIESMVPQEDYDQLEQQINTLEGSMSLKDNQIDKLVGRIEDLETTVTSLEFEISTLEVLSDVRLIDISFSRTEDTSSILQYWINRANETIQIMVMLITQDELADALIAAHDRGIDVDIIIDDDWYHSSGSEYQEILDAGIDIRGDERGGLMHHKIMIIDGYIIIIGSYNWSDSAEDTNDENIIILNSTTVATIYLIEFNRIWDQTIPAEIPEEPEVPEVSNIVINEIEQNPAGIDAGNEWIELYNPTDQTVDVSGWKISTTHGETVTLIITQGTIIDPDEYKVLTYFDQWLDNEDESVILRNNLNQIVDETPILSDTANSGWAWSRVPNGYDTDSINDWQFQSATKSYSND